MIKYVSVFLLITVITVRGDVVTDVTECSSGVPLPTTVEISGCSTSPCPLVKGTDAVLTLNFTTPYYMDSFNASVRASYSIISINFPLPDPDGCNGLKNTRCPLEANEPASYSLQMPVSSSYPSLSNLLLAFTLSDSNGEAFACFQVTTYVTSA